MPDGIFAGAASLTLQYGGFVNKANGISKMLILVSWIYVQNHCVSHLLWLHVLNRSFVLVSCAYLISFSGRIPGDNVTSAKEVIK